MRRTAASWRDGDHQWALPIPRHSKGVAVHCAKCDRPISPGEVVVHGTRFKAGPHQYVAARVPNAPIRNTRAEAIADVCAWHQSNDATSERISLDKILEVRR